MNKQNRIILLLTALFFVSIQSSYAQTIDTVEINGEQFFVYPFDASVGFHAQYFEAAKRSGSNSGLSYEYYKSMMFLETGEEVNKSQFRRFKREVRQYEDGFYDSGSRRDMKYLNSSKFKKAIRKNPYPLMQQRFQENSDLTPMLDPIPDGKYVQFFEEFCLMDEKGECERTFEQVAGYFSMKNNMLDGEAIWIDIKGDTLKHGRFENGIKEGVWRFERRTLEYMIDKSQVDLYIERGYPDMDTLVEYITYQKGAKNGVYRKFENSLYPVEEGYFTNGVKTSTWTYRDIVYRGLGSKRKRIRENELVTAQYSFESNDSLVVKPIWIRKGHARTYNLESDEFDFYSRYSIPDLPTKMYEIAYAKEENLELDEELEGAPYDMDYYEDDYYGEYEDGYYGDYDTEEFGYDEFLARSYDPESVKYINRGVLLDSIGGRPMYSGNFEKRYDNGQLAYRYTFENGLLLHEDTVFWDNGIPHDVITTLSDSNQFRRAIYDYNGKIYLEILYDSLGDFIRVSENYLSAKKYIIDGYDTELAGYGKFYFYDAYDTLGKDGMLDPTVLFQSWSADDSSKIFVATYNPKEKQFSTKGYSVTNFEMMQEEKLFADDFESWTGKKYIRVGNIELEQTSSGSLFEYYQADSIPIRHLQEQDKFRVASEYVLKKEGVAYTGPVELSFDAKKLKFSKNDLNIKLPQRKYSESRLVKDFARYRKTGKTKCPIEMNLLDATEIDTDVASYIFGDFFAEPLGGFFQARNSYYYEDYEDAFSTKKNAEINLAKIEGYMLDGRPNGLWVGYDQFGKKYIEVPYQKGEVHGQVISYDYAMPVEKNVYSWAEYENPFSDSTPEKRVHFVQNRTDFVNGMADGKSVSYSWYGGITEESHYKEGMLEGRSMERNKLATTIAHYKNDETDGYVRTYLTLRPGDSTLLYNLNFQDGMLQGESKAYHINGKLAKRGFFLNGQPIEDYEAYDSLGFKYHYVKFKYSFPIEEKIWEENELSVRYLFDWQDSIYFQPTDITTSQSLEAVISKLGLGGDYFERPYYGRHSLVNKNGINYHMTKYYPNDTISRIGDLENGRKTGCWKYYSYSGELLYEVDYKDSIISINDSIKFKSKGVLTELDKNGNPLYESYVIEMSSKYDCSHTDHYEVRQLYTRWEANDSLNRMNGLVRNFYDNGTLQSEGYMKNGLPDGVWKYFDPYGKLNQYGVYILGKRDARWLSGDLSKTKYLGDICLNPNLPDLDEEIKYRENLLDIKITNYDMGKALNTQYYDINMNSFIDEDEEMEESIDGEE